MISAALYEYLAANAGAASIFPSQAPLNATLPTLVLDNVGDSRQKHWQNGITSTGLITSEFIVTFWASTQVAALNLANGLIALMDNLSGVWLDTSTSPNTRHYVGLVEAEDNGWQFEPTEELYSASVFLTITHH